MVNPDLFSCWAWQCSAVRCSAVQCSSVQFSAVQCSAVLCSAVQCSAVQCSELQCNSCPSIAILLHQCCRRSAILLTGLQYFLTETCLEYPAAIFTGLALQSAIGALCIILHYVLFCIMHYIVLHCMCPLIYTPCPVQRHLCIYVPCLLINVLNVFASPVSMQCSAVQCSAVQCSALQFSAISP